MKFLKKDLKKEIPAVDDDNDDEIVGRILTRREAMQVAGAAGFALLVGCGGGGASAGSSTSATGNGSTGGSTGGTVDLVATPQVTEGPFFVDEKLQRSDLVSAGSSRTTVAQGVPLVLTFTIYSLSGSTGTPLANAYVDVWHCDAVGVYSDESSNGIQSEDTKGQTWLRGYQITDENGKATFQTIIPGWYMGRTTHIHFKVRTYSGSNETSEFTSQLFFTDTFSDGIYESHSIYDQARERSVYNTDDNIYSARQSDGSTVGSDLMVNVAPSGSGYVGTFNVALALSGSAYKRNAHIQLLPASSVRKAA